jgi:thiol-disulfide isomerase/thioredoxin
MNLVNQFSFPLIAIVLMALSIVILRRWLHSGWRVVSGVLIAIALLFMAGFVLFQPEDSDVRDFNAAIAALENNRPTIVVFFSKFCSLCITMEPLVNDLENDLESEFDILRVDIHTPVGRSLREQLSFSFTPEFVLYDSDGREVWRAHVPPGDDSLNRARVS